MKKAPDTRSPVGIRRMTKREAGSCRLCKRMPCLTCVGVEALRRDDDALELDHAQRGLAVRTLRIRLRAGGEGERAGGDDGEGGGEGGDAAEHEGLLGVFRVAMELT